MEGRAYRKTRAVASEDPRRFVPNLEVVFFFLSSPGGLLGMPEWVSEYVPRTCYMDPVYRGSVTCKRYG